VDIREWGFGGISLWVGELDVFCGKRIESCGEWLVLVGIEVSGVVGKTKEKGKIFSSKTTSLEM
jgi:hypothetical protein